MNDPASWHEGNARYLEAALAGLRQRLQRHIASLESAAPAGEASAADADAHLAALEALPPAAVTLARRFGLSRFEQNVLLLATAAELDSGIGPLCARAQDDPDHSYPTLALALALFDEPAWDALSPRRPLRFWHLLATDLFSVPPLLSCPLRTDERVVSYLKGINHLDTRLAPLLIPGPQTEAPAGLPPSQQAALAGLRQRFERARRLLPDIHLQGPDPAERELLAVHAAATLGLQLFRLPAEALPSDAAELELLTRLWQRECLLWPVALYAQLPETDTPSLPHRSALRCFLQRIEGVLFLDAEAARAGRPAVVLQAGRPTPAEQRAAWAEALGEAAADSPRRLAAQFDLSLSDIRLLAGAARAEDGADRAGLDERLWQACRKRTEPRLGSLAQCLAARATWADLVLPPPELALLRQIAGQVRARATVYDDWGFRHKMSRGLGISALFAGESGTGKTMAAEVLANDLGLSLFRIDLSAVIDKYVGETEKNLRRLFDAAEGGGAVLFFDEADALFGKRTEVKDSHDRFANIEIDYLLQRMEAYRGLAILATNRKAALDPAFLRRLRFLVHFPFPGPAERAAIWRRVFPAAVPRDELDYERLARLNLTGGSIHNVALNAAFLAAAAGSPVTMALLLDAARTELRKLDRPISEADFR
jgi:hypothetical protein